MVHIYHGDGKGKTTAALGLALRMLGAGKQVFMVQFLKGQHTGELSVLLKMQGVTVLRGRQNMKFVFQMTPEEKAEVYALQMRQLALAFEAARAERAQLLLLDEALDAVDTGTLDEDTLIDGIKSCPDEVESVLTGRNPSARLLEAASYVTHMKKEKHPFDRGTPARAGVEY